MDEVGGGWKWRDGDRRVGDGDKGTDELTHQLSQGSMTVNIDCQFARIQSPLGDKPLGMTERGFLDEFIEGGSIIS